MSVSTVYAQIGIKDPTAADRHARFLDPSVYDAYRRLKYAAEGIVLSGRQLANHIRPMVRKVTAAAQRLDQKSPTALSRANRALYRQICQSPYRTFIFQRAGLTESRPGYWYWGDRELLVRATAFRSWADMQQRDSALRAHLAGRGLGKIAMLKNPRLVNHVRFGLQGHTYRSLAELVVGNLFAHNGIKVHRQYPTGVCRVGSDRQMIADFYFPAQKLLLEVIQTRGSGTGSRKEEYELQFRTKVAGYRKSRLRYCTIDSEPYFKNGVLDALAFAKKVLRRLKPLGIACGPLPDASILLFEEHREKEKWLRLPLGPLMQSMADEMGIVGVAILTNDFSWLHALLKMRSDYDVIRQHLKTISNSISSEKRKRWIKQRDERRPPLSVVRKLCREEQISTQQQWFQFAKGNPGRLRSLGIPSNLSSVYTRLGAWISWPDVLAPKAQRTKVFRKLAAREQRDTRRRGRHFSAVPTVGGSREWSERHPRRVPHGILRREFNAPLSRAFLRDLLHRTSRTRLWLYAPKPRGQSVKPRIRLSPPRRQSSRTQRDSTR